MNHKLIIFCFIIALLPLIALREGFIGLDRMKEVTVENISTFTISYSPFYIYTNIKKNGIIAHRIIIKNNTSNSLPRFHIDTYSTGDIKDINKNKKNIDNTDGKCKDSNVVIYPAKKNSYAITELIYCFKTSEYSCSFSREFLNIPSTQISVQTFFISDTFAYVVVIVVAIIFALLIVILIYKIITKYILEKNIKK